MAAAFAVVGLALAACGSSKAATAPTTTPSTASTTADTSAAATTAAATTVAPASGEPINLMVIATVGKPGGDYPEDFSAAKAAAAAVNKAGGVNGRPINVLTCNDQLDPNIATECARTAVSSKAVAIVGNLSTFVDAWMPIVAAANIPSVGNLGVSASEATGANSFPIAGGTGIVSAANIQYLIKQGKTKIVVSYPDIPVLANVLKGIDAQVTKLGGTVVSKIPIPISAVDMAPYAAQMKNSGANGGLIIAATGSLAQQLTALYQAGVTSSQIQFAESTLSISPAQVTKLGPAVEGVALTGSFIPTNFTDNPGVVQFNKELDDAGVTDARGDIAVQAWASVHIIANVLKNAKTVDGAGLIAAMEAAGPIDFAPVAPFDWSKPSPAFLPRRVFSTSVVYSTVKDGKLVTDGKFVDTAAG